MPTSAGQRVYASDTGGDPTLEANLPAIWNVPDIAGYTPLQLPPVHVVLQTGENGRLLNPASRIADLAGIRYVALTETASSTTAASAPFGAADLGVFLSIARSEAPRDIAFGLPTPKRANRLVLVTALGASVDVRQGETVAVVTVRSRSGGTEMLPMRAGIETAELAYDRPDVVHAVRHRRATLFQHFGDNSWYVCSLPIASDAPIASIDVRFVAKHAALNIRKISLVDDAANRAYPIADESQYFADPKHFRIIGVARGVSVIENRRALPAMWMGRPIAYDTPVTNEVGYATLRETLLSLPSPLDALVARRSIPAGTFGSGTVETVAFEPEHRTAVATCSGRCLVVSNSTFTTDWHVSIDGTSSTLLPVDGVLQGVVVPKGRHTLDFRYAPRSTPISVALSSASSLIFAGWVIARRRKNRV